MDYKVANQLAVGTGIHPTCLSVDSSGLRFLGCFVGFDVEPLSRSWKHTGFDAWTGPELMDPKEIVRIGMYAVRSPAAAGGLVVDDELGLRHFGKGTRPEMEIGSLFEAPCEKMDPLEWIARLTSHILETGCQMTHYYGQYSNAYRGKEAKRGGGRGAGRTITAESEDEWIRAHRRSWARLI